MKTPKAHEFRWIDNRCKGCFHERDGRCLVYWNPSAWWERYGHCPLASHLLVPTEEEGVKVRVGQQKQRK